MLVFDVESDGFLDVLTRIHCLVIRSVETGEVKRYRGADVEFGVRSLMAYAEEGEGYLVAGHNVLKFDIPAITKIYPWFRVPHRAVLDTLVLGRLMFPDLIELDTGLKAKGQLPGKLFKKHSLEAWGYRMGNYKGDFAGPWDVWTQEMEDYCVQDVEVTAALLKRFSGNPRYPALASISLEHQVLSIVDRQERHGFAFNREAAEKLFVKLAQERIRLEGKLSAVFPPFYLREKEFTPKRDNKKMGYCEGAKLTKVDLTLFNPGSRHHIANRLKARYGWKPTEFTDSGDAKIDETVLLSLPYPEAKLLAEYFTVDKRIGQLAEGNEACLKKLGPDGRMHGAVNTNGAVTGRMSHFWPNVAQTPTLKAPWGREFRDLYGTFTELKRLVGADADALELRCLAHFMAHYDGGAYVQAVIAGSKADGTDAHSVNARAIGLDPKAKVHGDETGRDVAKTWFYAFIYGAGVAKLGLILTHSHDEKVCIAAGKKSRAAFLHNLPALKQLADAVKAKAKQQGGYLRGIDGRWIRVRSEHAALNTLLQCAGAVLMKQALVILDHNLQEMGYVPGVNYEFVANVHDEWQIECDTAIAEVVAKAAPAAIVAAGVHFNFRCPLAGDSSVGRTWADTH